MPKLGDGDLYGKLTKLNVNVRTCIKKVRRNAVPHYADRCRKDMDDLQAIVDQLEDVFDQYVESIDPKELADNREAFDKEQENINETLDEVQSVISLASNIVDSVKTPPAATGIVNSSSGEQFHIADLAKCFNNTLNRPSTPLTKYSGDSTIHNLWMDTFEKRIAHKLADDREIVVELLQYLEGSALKAVRRVAINPKGFSYTKVREILDEKFGKKVAVAQKLRDELLEGPPVTTAEEISDFLDDLATFGEALVHNDYLPHLDVMRFADELLDRLDQRVHNKWTEVASDYQRKHQEYPDYAFFHKFVKDRMAFHDDPFLGADARAKAAKRRNKKVAVHCMTQAPVSSSNQVYSQVTQYAHENQAYASVSNTPVYAPQRPPQKPRTPPQPSSADPKICPLCQTTHTLPDCTIFNSKSVSDRYDLCKHNRFCFKCLLPGHLSPDCKAPPCNYENCTGRHHHLLHGYPYKPRHMVGNVMMHTDTNSKAGRIMLPIVKLKVQNLEAYALLDAGSTATLITDKLADRLGLKGPQASFNMTTVLASGNQTSRLVSCYVKGVYESESYLLSNCFSVPQLPARNPEVSDKEINSYEHLRGIPWTSVGTEHVDILIGQDHSHLLLPHEFRVGRPGMPNAIKTLLGWAVQGPIASSILLKRANVNVIEIQKPPPEVYDDISKIWAFEQTDETVSAWSLDDQMVFQMWEDTWTSVDGRYQLPIPFKDPAVIFPDNRAYCLKRLHQTIKNLHRKGKFDSYKVEIELMLSKGYAEKVPEKDLNRNDGKVFYLPHFPVYHPDKPLKTRPVHDAAAEFEGVSLNNQCYSGPNLTTPLVHILTRFREYLAALGSDVTAMYLQLLIPVEQRDVLRFYWLDEQGNLIVLRMTRHIFGGVWCAASTTYAIRRAMREAGASAHISEVLEKSMYVDDLLHSLIKLMQAAQLASSIWKLGKSKNFDFVKWNGYPREAISEIPPECREKGEREIETDANTKTLGIRWDTSTDEFFYGKRLSRPEGALSKRIVLSLVASIYDPIGLIVPIIIIGRVLLQRATASKVTWDEALPTDITRPWEAWWEMLDELPNLRFPRCMIGNMEPSLEVQLHFFCDASEKAFGTAAYLRMHDPATGEIHTALIRAKGKVAPTKGETIPRLELCACVMGADLNKELTREMRLNVVSSTYWTDSEIALKYLRSSHLRLKTFVANRVIHILKHSNVEEWRHVPTDQNPADILSRGSTVKDLPDIWRYGPAFLRRPESEWPVQRELNIPEEALELKRDVVTCALTANAPTPMEVLLGYYRNDATRACAALAWWRRLAASPACVRALFSCNKTPKKNRPKAPKLLNILPISADELLEAEQVLILHEQRKYFKAELNALIKGESIPNNSSLKSLNPSLKGNFIVVGGRLRYAEIKPEMKHPIILPKLSDFTHAVLTKWHYRAHLGINWVLTKVKEKYHIPGARNMLRQIRFKCTHCIRFHDNPIPQMMADLPPERLKIGGFAFAHTGVDLFGPFYVTVGRARVKRYGVLFTCMQIRAVHIEIAHSLTAESFIMAFIRFCSRRGTPITCKSDRGTNIVGATEEMRKAWIEVDVNAISSHLAKANTQWSFNTPTDSAAGGVWERQIRTVRKVLCGVLNPNVKLDDEVLNTVMHEAESLVNSRPITYTGDAPDCTPLTPNHLLLLQRNSPADIAGIDGAKLVREKWKHIENLTNTFWKQWSNEYLLNLQQRVKGTAKTPNMTPGDLVLMMEPNLPRGDWRMGIVTDLRKLRDGLVRSVHVRTAHTRYERPVNKLVRLGLQSLPESI